MATKRTSGDLIVNLFQDGQAEGAITPADMRDFIESMVMPYGSLSMTTPAATTIAVAGTYYKANGTTTISTSVEEIANGSVNNRLVYTGTPDRHFNINASISMTTASNSQIVGMKLAKNGVVLDETQVRRKVGTGSDLGAAGVMGCVTLSTDDFIELFVTNETSTTTVTIETLNLSVSGVFV
jgi:hypothetical protein